MARKRIGCYAKLGLPFHKILYAVPSKMEMHIGDGWATTSTSIGSWGKNPFLVIEMRFLFQRDGP
jgi:hypothetical protein